MTKDPKRTSQEMIKKGGQWTFLSNHAHVLICLSKDPDMRLKDVALLVGITERAVQAIVKDLVDACILEKSKDGRRNQYIIQTEEKLRHPLEANHSISELLRLGK
ncbi:ArsR family transcriptional regulator [Leptospira sp. 2 VSF19]|uniref:ArsR family transcriptional regulator n=1 Tax=Leptospira soteropolitanensis TaxID=2950025 RepID=A0AAW5VLK6_9LEPT|nr:ArsR family transcriptional regulator [Leptospira soteropolitanensis]MCW7493612.1 ArsR family transcriptional regulator [Leptospira soteropolitanensis]MCW7501211.1 ArsR family transcriptional regulator [Leptospira soteropolitanensis]MCW7523603.1 ArsR family transcriptional regulator [Leptospira soteropolitanensis]MCW7527324.1 ArsR family transcriptional regulator [Leptospira soteropolitanensis]MCW7531181.1 ArsR family transcriptional regulator [Leptospira soteropolitanensis]